MPYLIAQGSPPTSSTLSSLRISKSRSPLVHSHPNIKSSGLTNCPHFLLKTSGWRGTLLCFSLLPCDLQCCEWDAGPRAHQAVTPPLSSSPSPWGRMFFLRRTCYRYTAQVVSQALSMAWETQMRRRPQSQQSLQLASLATSQSEPLASLFKLPRLPEKGKEEYHGIRS